MAFAITPQIYLLCGQKMSPLKLNDVKFIGVEPSLHQINQTMWNYRVREWMSLRLAVRRRCSCIFTTRRS